MTYDLVCKKSQFINSSNIHKFFAMTATNNANSLHGFWDGAPEPLKITQRGGCAKGSLSCTNADRDATPTYGAMHACGDSRVGIC